MSNTEKVIQIVSEMLDENEFTDKNELIENGKEIGWKPVTINFAISKLKKADCIIEKKEGEKKMFKLKKQYRGENKSEKIIDTQGYRTKKSNYRREIKDLDENQANFKKKVLGNRSELMNKPITWVTPEGLTMPLVIAGMGDVTLRCRMFMKNVMESEEETGLLLYIPWHEKSISQLYQQIDDLLNKDTKHVCFDINQLAPAK